jgi:hypothetical protein
LFHIVPYSSVLSVPKLCQEVFTISPQTVGITGFFANVPFSLRRGTGVAQPDTRPGRASRPAPPDQPPLPSQGPAPSPKGKRKGGNIKRG